MPSAGFHLLWLLSLTQTRPHSNLYACTAYEKHLQKQFKFSNLTIKSNLVH